VKKNLENLVSVSCGTNVVIVYKRNNNDVFVSVAGKTPPKVVLDRITDRSYSYCQAGVRKYTVIKVEGTVEGHRFSIFFQFRDGTKGGGSDPKYLRLLMKKAGTSLPDK
jgi:hypothetical protein